jgi:hypothetical protein
MNANSGLGNLYNTGFGMGNQIGGMMTNSGNAFQKDAQNQMNTDKAQFENDRDFQLDQYNKYMSGILGQAPRTTGQITPNLYDPQMSGLMGAVQGFGMGGKMQNAFNNQGGGTGGGTNYGTSGNAFNYYTPSFGSGSGTMPTFT